MSYTYQIDLSWREIVLAIIPGIGLIIIQGWNISFLYEMTILLVAIVTTLLVIYIHQSRFDQLLMWKLPIFGGLLWYIWYVFRWSPFGLPLMIPLIIIGTIAQIIVLLWFYRHFGDTISRFVWTLIFLLLVVTVSINYLYGLTSGVFDFLFLLSPIAIGYPISKRVGLSACLFVLAFEPAWMDIMYSPKQAIIMQLQNDSITSIQLLELSLFMFNYFPFLGFLIVIPIGFLWSSSNKERILWLTIPSIVLLLGLGIMRGVALAGTPFQYSVSDWVVFMLIGVQLWIPLLLTSLLYADSFES